MGSLLESLLESAQDHHHQNGHMSLTFITDLIWTGRLITPRRVMGLLHPTSTGLIMEKTTTVHHLQNLTDLTTERGIMARRLPSSTSLLITEKGHQVHHRNSSKIASTFQVLRTMDPNIEAHLPSTAPLLVVPLLVVPLLMAPEVLSKPCKL
jgi:hypothetical protein